MDRHQDKIFKEDGSTYRFSRKEIKVKECKPCCEPFQKYIELVGAINPETLKFEISEEEYRCGEWDHSNYYAFEYCLFCGQKIEVILSSDTEKIGTFIPGKTEEQMYIVRHPGKVIWNEE